MVTQQVVGDLRQLLPVSVGAIRRAEDGRDVARLRPLLQLCQRLVVDGRFDIRLRQLELIPLVRRQELRGNCRVLARVVGHGRALGGRLLRRHQVPPGRIAVQRVLAGLGELHTGTGGHRLENLSAPVLLREPEQDVGGSARSWRRPAGVPKRRHGVRDKPRLLIALGHFPREAHRLGAEAHAIGRQKAKLVPQTEECAGCVVWVGCTELSRQRRKVGRRRRRPTVLVSRHKRPVRPRVSVDMGLK